MYFNIKNKGDYELKNELYKQAILPLLDYIFNSNKIVFGYIKSTPDNLANQRRHILDPIAREGINLLTSDEEIIASGGFEECLKTHIISQDFSVLILTGASGSGKTSVVKYVINNLDECTNKEHCVRYDICKNRKKRILYFDLIDSYSSPEQHILIEKYEFRLNGYLNLAVNACFGQKDTFAEFLNYLKISGEKEDGVLYNLFLLISPLNFSWNIDDVLIKIKHQGTIVEQNELLIGILRYFRMRYPDTHKGCFTLIYDNIDKLDDEDQIEIIKKIISLHNSINCKLVITSRLTTFSRLKDNFSNIFSVIENAGPTPLNVIYFRIKYYLDNRSSIQEIIDIRERIQQANKFYPHQKDQNESNYLERFDKILSILLTYLSPIENIPGGIKNEESQQINLRKERIQRTIEAFSGLSVRRGLELSKRFIDTFVYNYSKDPTPNELISSLSFRSSRGIEFNDRYLTNIFGKYENHHTNSWLLYRILNILNICHEYKIPISVHQLVDIINLFVKIDDTEIIGSINQLIDSQKRLAYISGQSTLREIDRSSIKSQRFHITNSGKQYLTFLSIDLPYIQNCFASLDWKPIKYYIKESEINSLFKTLHHQHVQNSNWLLECLNEHYKMLFLNTIPAVFYMSNFFQRMHFIRLGLEVFLYYDIFESYYFNKRKNDQKYIQNIPTFLQYSEYFNSFPSLNIIITSASTFHSILKTFIRNNPEMKIDLKELKEWHILVSKVDLWHKLLFNTSNSYSQSVNDLYTELIKNYDK